VALTFRRPGGLLSADLVLRSSAAPPTTYKLFNLRVSHPLAKTFPYCAFALLAPWPVRWLSRHWPGTATSDTNLSGSVLPMGVQLIWHGAWPRPTLVFEQSL